MSIKKGDRLLAKLGGFDVEVEAVSGESDGTVMIKQKGVVSPISVHDVRMIEDGLMGQHSAVQEYVEIPYLKPEAHAGEPAQMVRAVLRLPKARIDTVQVATDLTCRDGKRFQKLATISTVNGEVVGVDYREEEIAG